MKLITDNRRARFDYHILESIEAGIVLTGDEVKSLRAGNANLSDAYATAHNNNIQLLNCYIGPYSHAFIKDDSARRSRRLLLHKAEINKITGAISRKGLTVIPLKLYFSGRGYVKVELGLAQHKKNVDKRETIKERDIARETRRALKNDRD
jgi:SsrA-binding protein